MSHADYIRWLHAHCLLLIWSPDRMNFIDRAKRRRGRQLFYRSMGIVLHDRALNGEKR